MRGSVPPSLTRVNIDFRFGEMVSRSHLQNAARSLWERLMGTHKTKGRKRQPIGLLYVVYTFNTRMRNPYYLHQAVASARSARALNPHLPCALATNLEEGVLTANGTVITPEPFQIVYPTKSMRGLRSPSPWCNI